MGKKDVPQVIEANPQGIMKYLPLILIVILIGVCYFLYKRMNKYSDEIEEIKEDSEKNEEKYDNFVKNQIKHNNSTVQYVEMLMKNNPTIQRMNIPPRETRLENIKEDSKEDSVDESKEDSVEDSKEDSVESEPEDIIINTQKKDSGKKKGVINIIN